MSTWTCSKPASVAGKDYKGAFNLVCRWALDCWQSGQEPVQHATLRFMSGQTKRCAIKWLDALTTGWGKPCNFLKMCCRTADGTSGRGRPCEVSHKTVWLEFGIGTCSSCRVVLVKGSLLYLLIFQLSNRQSLKVDWKLGQSTNIAWKSISYVFGFAFNMTNAAGKFGDVG